jgi:hypothetical protein
MKHIKRFAAAAFAICLITTAGYAQSTNLKLRFHAPFPFTVENTKFTTGDYEVTEPSHLILEVRNLQNQNAAFEHAQPARSKEADGRMRLVFHRYDNEYFLALLSDGSVKSTYDFRQSKEEKRLANASPKPRLRIVSVRSNGTVQEASAGRPTRK